MATPTNPKRARRSLEPGTLAGVLPTDHRPAFHSATNEPPDDKPDQRKGLLSEEADKANSETLLSEIGSAGPTGLFSLSDGKTKTREGASSGLTWLPPGEKRPTNLLLSQS